MNRNGLSGTFSSTGDTSTRRKCFCAGSQPTQALGTLMSDCKRSPEEKIATLTLWWEEAASLLNLVMMLSRKVE